MLPRLLLNWDRHVDFPDAKPPYRAHPTDAGMDVFAAEDTIILPGQVIRMRTGICIAPSWVDHEGNLSEPTGYNIPGGWTLAALAWDKSGIGAKGATVLGGVIDESYRGEIQVIMANVNTYPVLDHILYILGLHLTQSKKSIQWNNDAIRGALEQPITFLKGEKLTQLLIERVELPLMADKPTPLTNTVRGAGGFGSTGK